MKRLKDIYQKITGVTSGFNEDHVGAYAAQSAYFFMLCMIPIILLLITMVQYTPVTKADVMTAVIQVFPSSVENLITSIVNQVYNQSTGVIPVTIVVALWSAGKGVLAMASGLNCIYRCRETRNYIVLRIRATFYTLLFIIVIILLLVLSVFGNTLNLFIAEHIPFLRRVADQLIAARVFITPTVLVIFSLMLYRYLPNRRGRFRDQLPGAMFSTVGWMAFSFAFSLYFSHIGGKNYSYMYGSLTAIVLLLLWLYFCMCILFFGAEINYFWKELFPGETAE